MLRVIFLLRNSFKNEGRFYLRFNKLEVAEITTLGGEEREIQVKVDQDKLKLYRISHVQVVEAINRSGIDLPAGKVQTDKESNSVRLTGKFSSVDDINYVQIAMPMPGSPIYVKDVADVVDGTKEMTSVSRYNGKNGIGLYSKTRRCQCRRCLKISTGKIQKYRDSKR